MEVIKLRNICKNYYDSNGNKFEVLKNINLEWKRGTSISIMGNSGCGKSTLLKILCGIEKPTSGKLFFDEQSVESLNYAAWRKKRANLQAVFQDSSGTLNRARSVYKNVEEALINLSNLNKRERDKRIIDLMTFFGMDLRFLTSKVSTLSGGEQRRISLIRALSIRPKFLLLDEITAGLDIVIIDTLVDILQRYKKEFGLSYLIITHDEYVAKRLCEINYILKDKSLSKTNN